MAQHLALANLLEVLDKLGDRLVILLSGGWCGTRKVLVLLLHVLDVLGSQLQGQTYEGVLVEKEKKCGGGREPQVVDSAF